MVALGGCAADGGATAALGAEGSIDACGMLTKADATEAFREPAADPNPSVNLDTGRGDGSACSWHTRNPTGKSIDVGAQRLPSVSEAVEAFASATASAADPQPVEGTGDRALWDEAGQILLVLAGDVVFNVTTAGLDAEPRAAAAEVAERVLEHL